MHSESSLPRPFAQPSDYAGYLASLPAGPDGSERAKYALKAFSHTATYDTAVAEWMQSQLCEGRTAVLPLKYGCNPQQKPASVRGLLSPLGPQPLPFSVLCGTPGYINLLDAVNAWQLVKELGQATGLPAAASFKHVSPAGAAVYAPLSDDMLDVYEAAGKQLSRTAVAYLRSRQAERPASARSEIARDCPRSGGDPPLLVRRLPEIARDCPRSGGPALLVRRLRRRLRGR